MKLIISHLNGNPHVRAALKGFVQANLLFKFYTSIAVFSGSLLDRLGAFKCFSAIRYRTFSLEVKPFILLWPWFEVPRLLTNKIGLGKLLVNKNSITLNYVCKNFDKKVSSNINISVKKEINAIYGYEDTSLLTFRQAKRVGLKCLYDLPISYWREGNRLLEIEKHQWPGWISTMNNFSLSEEALSRKDEELKLADRIFVASSFTAKTLKSYPGILCPVDVIPYGFPSISKNITKTISLHGRRPLKLIFVGTLTQRKGLANLFAAVEQLGRHVNLTVVGSPQASNSCRALKDELVKHTWFPNVSHKRVLALMGEHDVLVFPSLFEGFGLVISEAMSQGTPVLTTERTGGKDLIENGENGWIVEAGSTTLLQAAIEELLVRPHLISKVARAALETARLRPWELYGKELAQSVIRALKS